MTTADLYFLPLGGAEEIGMNCYLYGQGSGKDRQWLMVDLGMSFPDARMPGIDRVLPNIDFAIARRESLAGIVITHAHEDHSGALVALWDKLRVPVYTTRFAWELIQRRSDTWSGELSKNVHIVKGDSEFTVGDFDLAFVQVPHSIPQAQALVIRHRLGSVIHSGDWKTQHATALDTPFSLERFRTAMRGECLALVGDSTNATIDDTTGSEDSLLPAITKQLSDAEGRVAVTTFSSNLARMLTIFAAATATSRRVLVLGRAMERTLDAAAACGLLPKTLPLVAMDAARNMPRHRLVILTTGSQGEPNAALSKLAFDNHRLYQLEAGDKVLYSSRTIPGNEAATSMVQNQLIRRGIEVVSADDARIHVSGHPRREELLQLYRGLKPKLLLPVHGEANHIAAHVELGRRAGIAQARRVDNGQMVSLSARAGEVIDEIEAGIWCVDGKAHIRLHDPALKQRRGMMESGVITVAVVCNKRGEIAVPICVVARGVVGGDEIELRIEKLVAQQIAQYRSDLRGGDDRELDRVENMLRRRIRQEVASLWGKKPDTVVRIELVK